MAEFCFNCFNKVNEINEPESKYILSEDLCLCEECGQYKRVVMEKKAYYLYRFRFLTVPFYIIWRIIIVPYTIYHYCKLREKQSL